MKYFFLMCLVIFTLLCCERAVLIEPAGITIDMEDDTVVFAQIGDFGDAGLAELRVSQLVKSWNPDFIISVGDNNYNHGEFSSIKSNISNYYGDYIYNFDAPVEYGCYGKAFEDKINRFFPTPGNHDADNKDGLVPYYNYFTLPGNEKYYKFTWGPLAIFSINTVENNLDEQRIWLENELLLSDKPFNIVFLHHPPYSSGPHGDSEFIQWDFEGVDVVFAGHDHVYERIRKLDTATPVYIVNGLGGRALNECINPHDPSLFSSYCYGSDYGAVKGIITSNSLQIDFYSAGSPEISIDGFTIVQGE
jgi:tartrate-resistant acid phosphatase type 5